MKMRYLLLFLFLVPLAFAAWQNVAMLAMGLSLTLLAIVYMVGMGFGINEMQMLAKDEFVQLIALAVMIVVLFAGDGLLNGISTSPAFREGSALTMQDTATAIIDTTLANATSLLGTISDFDASVATEASRASQCSLTGGGWSLGYGVSACGGYAMLAAPLSMSGGIVGFAIGELSAMKKLILMTETYALSLLLPLGILLRTFKITRGAGGLLMALGISLHIMLPAGVIFNEMLGATFLAHDHPADVEEQVADYRSEPSASIAECEPGDTNVPVVSAGWEAIDVGDALPDDWSDSNENKAVAGYMSLRKDIRAYIYTIFIRATLGPILALLMVMASVRALTALAGAEVDVSAISRFV